MQAIELYPNLQLGVSPDKSSLVARLNSLQVNQDLNADHLLSVLGRHGFVLDAEQTQHARAMCAASTRVVEDGQVVLVRAVPAKAPVPPEFIVCEEVQIQVGRPTMVEAGTTVARVRPGSPGAVGRDLFGATIPVPPSAGSEPVVGMGCTRADDKIIASASGSLHVTADRIEVVPVLLHEGRYEATMPPIDFAGDVVIVGDVSEGVRVSATHAVLIEGTVESCDITAGADITIAGPVAASGNGRLRAGRTIRAHRAQGAELTAGADIHIDHELSHCVARAAGAIHVGSRIIGSRVSAVGGLSCESLGSVGAAKTIVEIGIDDQLREDYRRTMPAIELQRKKIAKVRQTVEPLLRNVKQLTGPQKEKATELLCEADEIEHQTNDTVQRLTQRLENLKVRQNLSVEIREQVHAGVVVRFPGVESTLRLAMRGPIRIACRREGAHTLVVGESIDRKGTCRPIEMRVTGDDRYDALERMLNPHSHSAHTTRMSA